MYSVKVHVIAIICNCVLIYQIATHKHILLFSSVPEMASASQQISKRDAKLDASGTNKSYDIKLENIDVSYGDK